MHIDADKLVWNLEKTNNSEKFFVYDENHPIPEKVACVMLQFGILNCYPVVDDEIMWSENICFMCLDNCDTKSFSDISDEILHSFFKKCEDEICKYYE